MGSVKHICKQCGAEHKNHSDNKPCKLCGGSMERFVLDYKKRILDIMQEMEGLHGPELDEYIQVMGDVATEAEQRTQNAMRQRDDINAMLPEPVDQEFMDKAKKTYEEADDIPFPLSKPPTYLDDFIDKDDDTEG